MTLCLKITNKYLFCMVARWHLARAISNLRYDINIHILFSDLSEFGFAPVGNVCFNNKISSMAIISFAQNLATRFRNLIPSRR